MALTLRQSKTAAQIAAMDVFEKNKYDLQTSFRKSKAWYEQQMILLMKQQISPNFIMKGNPSQLTTRLLPGKMYMFIYDPLYKKELPYYDRFPCVLLYKRSLNGFSGLNFHYLPYQMRVQLLYRMMVFKTNAKMDESTRLKFTWAAIKGVAKFAPAVPAFHNYNFGGLRTTFREIRAYDWTTAVLLPVEQMIKRQEDKVWNDSRKIINRIS